MGSEQNPKLYVVATLLVRPGQLRAFEAYEREALGVAERYGGRLERSIRSSAADGGHTEVHVLTFPTLEAFASFRANPQLAGLSDRRESIISSTQVITGTEGPTYAT